LGRQENAVTHIYHITPRAAWEAAREQGSYRPASLESEGFIHLSQAHQVVQVADSFYAGIIDLVLLQADTDLLRAHLRWEPPVGLPAPREAPAKDLFPHLYGPLNLDAVLAAHDFPPGPDGLFRLPATLATAAHD
jgi:uncharacterized protein (DUF952 family)